MIKNITSSSIEIKYRFIPRLLAYNNYTTMHTATARAKMEQYKRERRKERMDYAISLLSALLILSVFLALGQMAINAGF